MPYIRLRPRLPAERPRNLRRTRTGGEGDADTVSQFLDAVVAAVEPQDPAIGDFYWCLERNDYAEQSPHMHAVSTQLDRVLTRFADGGRLVAWEVFKCLPPNASSAASEAANRRLGRQDRVMSSIWISRWVSRR